MRRFAFPFLGVILLGASANVANARTLNVPNLSVEANAIPVYSLAVYDKEIFYTVPRRSAIVLTPFKGIAKDREASFGKFLDSQKYLIKDTQKNFLAHFGVVVDEQFLIFDGIAMNSAIYSPKDQRIWRFGDIAFDRLRPHADRGGEATRSEISQLRQQFLRDIKAQRFEKLTHIRQVPEKLRADRDQKTMEFLVTTTLPTAPLVSMHCEREGKVNCVLMRRCPINLKDIAGVAIWEEKKILLAAKGHEISVYNFNSCHSLALKSKLTLTDKLPEVSDLAIDQNGVLWVATKSRDPVTHGSIFLWPKEEWN